jgi:hypothetical protein
VSPPAYTGYAATSPPSMYFSQNPYAPTFRPAIQVPSYPNYVQQGVDPAKKKHDQRVSIADNLNIVNNLMSIGMTLFGNGN